MRLLVAACGLLLASGACESTALADDEFDPAYVPGTGTPEPNGLTPREVFPLLRRLCAEIRVVGFELVEANPLVDPGYTTAQNASQVLRECLNGIALRKKGITDKHYLSPLTVDHNRN